MTARIWILLCFILTYQKILPYEQTNNSIPYSISFIYDKSNEINRHNVLNRRFSHVNQLPFNNGLTNGIYWICITATNNKTQLQRCIFEVREPYISMANIFIIKHDTLSQLYKLGNNIKSSEKQIINRNLAFYINLKPGVNRVYIQVKYHRNVSFLFFIHNNETYLNSELKAWFFFSFYYGFSLAIILFNFFYYIKFQDSIFGYYAITVCFLNIGFICLDGIHVFLLPPGWLLTNLDIVSYISLAFIGGHLFASRFLHINELFKKSRFIEYTLIGCITLFFSLCLFKPSGILFAIGLSLLFILSFYYWILSIIFIKKNKYARFFTIAYCILTFSLLLYAIPITFGFDILLTGSWILKIGGLFEMMVLSYANVFRMSTLNKENLLMQSKIKSYLIELQNKNKQIETNKKRNEFRIEESKYVEIRSAFDLTDREIEVLRYIMSDKTNSQIANSLFVSVNTIKYHIKNIYRKLNTNNRNQIKEELNKVLN
nr:LuxR C-terminal-related transcriptional regulator [uncultured Carboxylicivirga sp.]